MNEIKIIVEGLEYEIDEHGNVTKRRGKGSLKPFPDKDGYLKLAFTIGDKTVNKVVHRLVYETFVGPIPPGHTIDHIDSNKTNNHYSNLQVLTFEDNAIKGNAKHWTLLSPAGEVVKVYNLRQFCRDMGLHPSHLYEVLHEKPKYKSHKGWRKHHEH
ncbi:hypothetical protein D3C85_166990 [compost metagenome]